MELQRKITDEKIRLNKINEYLNKLVEESNEQFKIVKNPDGSYGFYFTVNNKELIKRVTLADIYNRCSRYDVTEVDNVIDTIIIELLKELITDSLGK